MTTTAVPLLRGWLGRIVAPRAEAWAPVTGTRWIETGSRATLMAVLMAAAYGLAGFSGGAAPIAFWLLIGAGALLVPLAPRLRPSIPAHWWLEYVWTALGVTILTVFAATQADPLEVWLPLWALIAVNAAYALPLRGQLVVQAVGVLTLAYVLGAHGRPASDLILHGGLYVVLAVLSYTLCRRLRSSIAAARVARHDAEVRSQLLAALASLNELEPDRVALAAVTALNELGYEMATFGRVDLRQRTMIPLATAGFRDETHRETVVPIGEGLAGEALRRGTPVSVADYHEFEGRLPGRDEIRGAIAVPILIDHRPAAVLLGARRDPGRLSDEHLEVIELLAAQAARALRAGTRFAAERETAVRLGELDQLKSDFIASVTHELRTPLTVILGVGQTLTDPDRADEDQQRTMLQRLQANADRLDQLIGTLLDLSHLEAGAVEIRPVRLRLADVVEHVLEDLQKSSDDHRVEVDVEDVEVEADATYLRRVLSVLIGNAVTHTPNGTTIRLSARPQGISVRIVIEDDGPGIPEDELPFVADRFFRGGPSTRRTSSGLGIGLAVARQVLAEHGTELTIENIDGGGARFAFELPSAARATAPTGQSGGPG